MKKLCFLIFIISFYLRSNAQTVQAPIIFSTLTQMENYTGNYFQGIIIDSATGGLFTKKASVHSANNVTTFPSAASGYLWFKLAASPISNFVTIQQLNDSLNDYVTRYSPQTILFGAPKIWMDNQTFKDTIMVDPAVIFDHINDNLQNLFFKSDSLSNVGGTQYSTIFRNTLRGLSYSKRNSMTPSGVVDIYQNLAIKKAGDTIVSNDNIGALSAQVSFHRDNSADDTLRITATDSKAILKALSSGVVVTKDSLTLSLQHAYFDINIPVVGSYGSAFVTNHGRIKDYRDYQAGGTQYILGGADSGFSIDNRTGLYIEDLTSNPINHRSKAIYQAGVNDTIYLLSSKVQTPNIPTATGVYNLQLDANGNWNKVAYVAHLSATPTLDFGATSAQTETDIDITVTGAAIGDHVAVSTQPSVMRSGGIFTADVTATNTVTVKFNNYSAGSLNPSSGTFWIDVTPHQ